MFRVHAPRRHAEEVAQGRDVAVNGRRVDVVVGASQESLPKRSEKIAKDAEKTVENRVKEVYFGPKVVTRNIPIHW